MRTIIVGFLLVAVSTQALADKYSLVGISSIGVLVEGLGEDSKDRTGLTERELKTALELRLRQNGIKVYSTLEAGRAGSENITAHYLEGSPGLYLNVNILPARSSCVYVVTLVMSQTVMLLRDPTKETLATTWETPGELGYGPCNKIGESILERVARAVDAFSNDYLAANPK